MKLINSKDRRKDSSLIIEFIGPPGVGKTTFCGLVMKRMKRHNTKFINADDIRYLLRSGLLPGNKLSGYHEEIFNHYLIYLVDLKKSETDKVKDLRFNISELECDVVASSINDIVFNDEGLGHHFSDILIMMAKNEKGQSYIKEYLSNRIIVFLDLPESIILERNKHRLQTETHLWDGFIGLTENQMVELIREDIIIKKELCELLSQLQKGSVLTITDSNENDKSIDIVENAVKNHILEINQKYE